MSRVKSASSSRAGFLAPRLREGALIALVSICLYLCLALFSFDPSDPGWSYTGTDAEVKNLVGFSGAWISDVSFFGFGYLSFVFPLVFAFAAWKLFRGDEQKQFSLLISCFRFTGLLLILICGSGLADLHFYEYEAALREGAGGVIGSELARLMLPLFGYVGTTLILIAVFFFGLTVFADVSWLRLMDNTGRLCVVSFQYFQALMSRLLIKYREKMEVKQVTAVRRKALERHVEESQNRAVVVIEAPSEKKSELSKRVVRESQGNLFKTAAVDGLPTLHLLDSRDPSQSLGYSEDDLQALSRLLELKLKDYGIEATVVSVLPGPVITRFEIQPAAGIKVSRISGLSKDLARSLAVTSVRVVEVIPGKSVVGIEIPNVDRAIVKLSDVLMSKAYDQSVSPLTLALGHDIGGDPVVVDLTKMPHLLVAGTTGSGKSVALNAMILSILFKASPEDVRMIMIDPKMLELAVYEGIPHLLTEVVTDMKDASSALRWCVGEMERRYRLMAALGVRNMAGFNRKVIEASQSGKTIVDPLWQPDPLLALDEQTAPELEKLPYIVVVIDELADMMMIVGKKVEELIARIAQKARAAGIHLILATQRPSVDVITGLIKANIPTRIGFQVSSKVDSRTILDQGGAEQLLGNGDMLYLPAGSPLPIRIHGAFVDDNEVVRVVESWKELGEPNYLPTILEPLTDAEILPGIAGMRDDTQTEEIDEFYDEAVAFVTQTRRASISSVQRKFRIGYNRAARLIEAMELAGIVSEMNNNGSREVLASAAPE